MRSSIHFLKKSFTLIGLSAVSSLANAGANLTFGYSILAAPAPPPAVSATPVPTTSDALLVVLGLLLVVVAVRALQSSRGVQKLMSVVVMGGGLVLGGIGVDNTVATVAEYTIPDEGSPCSGGTLDVGYPGHGGTTLVTSNCEDDLNVDSVDPHGFCDPGDVVIPSATIPAGDTVTAPYCPDPT